MAISGHRHAGAGGGPYLQHPCGCCRRLSGFHLLAHPHVSVESDQTVNPALPVCRYPSLMPLIYFGAMATGPGTEAHFLNEGITRLPVLQPALKLRRTAKPSTAGTKSSRNCRCWPTGPPAPCPGRQWFRFTRQWRIAHEPQWYAPGAVLDAGQSRAMHGWACIDPTFS